MNRHILYPALAAAIALASSCSVVNSLTHKGKTDTQNTVATTPTGTPAATVPSTEATKAPAAAPSKEPAATEPKKKDKKKKPAVQAERPAEKNTAPTLEVLTEGRWTLASVGDKQINLEDEQPYVAFDKDGRLYASDGCNILNGSYRVDAKGKMTFGQMISTMKYCPEVDFAPAITAIFGDGRTVAVDCRRIGQDTYLYIKDGGRTLATFRRHNMEFLNGAWTITSAEGKAIDDEEANLFIDIAELKVHGNTGCNYFNGAIYIDPSRSNAIDFSNMGLTRMACPKSDQERAIMVALETAASAIAGKNADTVLLLDAKGKELMTLRRSAVAPEE